MEKIEQKKLEELKRLWLFGVQLSEFIKEENENFLKLSTKELQEMVINNACIFDLCYDGHMTSDTHQEEYAERIIKLVYKQIEEKNNERRKDQ
jgi:hypothetical protein